MTPLILAVDTTHESGSLALVRGGEVLEEIGMHAPDGFAHVLYGHLGALLERHGIAAGAIDCFAAASGPGSFTGVRVGLACIKGLAEAAGKPAVAVSTLEAMASLGSAPFRAPLLDARRGEWYSAVYDGAGRLLSPETVGGAAPLLQTLAGIPAAELELVAFGGPPEGFPPLPEARWVAAPRALAAAVARIAAGRFARGEACDPAALDANYIRRSDAELYWKE